MFGKFIWAYPIYIKVSGRNYKKTYHIYIYKTYFHKIRIIAYKTIYTVYMHNLIKFIIVGLYIIIVNNVKKCIF